MLSRDGTAAQNLLSYTIIANISLNVITCMNLGGQGSYVHSTSDPEPAPELHMKLSGPILLYL